MTPWRLTAKYKLFIRMGMATTFPRKALLDSSASEIGPERRLELQEIKLLTARASKPGFLEIHRTADLGKPVGVFSYAKIVFLAVEDPSLAPGAAVGT
jgi:hypothetical protein